MASDPFADLMADSWVPPEEPYLDEPDYAAGARPEDFAPDPFADLWPSPTEQGQEQEQEQASPAEGGLWDDIATLAGSGVGPAAAASVTQAGLGLLRGAMRLPGDAARWGEALGESIDQITGDRIPSWGNPGRWIQGAGEALATGSYLPEGQQGGLNATAEAIGNVSKGLTQDYGPFRRLEEKGKLAEQATKALFEKGDASGVLNVITDPEAVVGFIGNAAPSLAVSYLSGGFGPGVQLATISLMEAMEVSENAADFEKRTGQKVAPADFMAAQGQAMTLNAVFEKLGLDAIVGGKGGFWRRLLGGGLGEGGTEGAQNTNTNLATQTYIDPNKPLTEGLLPSVIGGAGSGGAAGGLSYLGSPEGERRATEAELKGALGLNEPPAPTGAPLTEQGLAGALGMSLPERQPVPTEQEIIAKAREDAQRILRGETLDIAETPPVDQLRLNPGYTAPEHEIVMQPVPGGVELAPGALYSRDIEAERPMDLPAGPFAATQPALPTIAPAPTELPKPRMRMPAARSTTMPAPEAGATSGQIESPPPTAGTPQAVPTEPPGPREPPGPPPAPPAAPAGPGGPAEATAAEGPTQPSTAPDTGAERAAAAPTEQFPIEESDFSRQRRESAELTELVEVDAQAALEAFEEDRGEALAWNPKRTAKLKEIVGSGGKIDAYPQVAINNGKFDVGDGRHRIALAAERGETITLAAHPDEVAAIRQRLGAPAAPQSSRIAPLPPPPPDGSAAPGGRVGKRRAPAKVDILTPVSRRGRAAKAAAPAIESAAPGVSPGAAAATAAPAPPPSAGPAAAPTVDAVPATAAYFDVTGQSHDPDGRPKPRDVLVYDAQGEQVARFPFDKSDDAVAFAGELKKARNLPHRWEYRPASAAQPPAPETPKAETPKAETPRAETPKAETPKAETPKAETPKAETPSAADAGMADEGAPTTTSTAVEQAPAPTEEPDRETLYGKLRGKDVTVQVEVAGREVEVTRYAAEALREADNLVAALEEIRETCL